jgi:hypothetical protein
VEIKGGLVVWVLGFLVPSTSIEPAWDACGDRDVRLQDVDLITASFKLHRKGGAIFGEQRGEKNEPTR